MTPEENLQRLNLVLPPPPDPIGVYKPFLIDNNYVYVSGHGPLISKGKFMIGRIGEAISADEGKAAARQVGLAILATLRTNLGTLNKIERVIKVLGMVNATTDFHQHPFIINGCSELFAEIWGNDAGIGVRSAVGMATLPDNIPVEIEAMFKLA
ncbi:RidA family protein [Hydrotalea sp.]|uniref:RidA family protein n=1 Tax=Hydrotalea sp. TaxID=2881279 RepID=UPI0025838E2F|nr:RidA family protein [Hydrotalea sp.]